MDVIGDPPIRRARVKKMAEIWAREENKADEGKNYWCTKTDEIKRVQDGPLHAIVKSTNFPSTQKFCLKVSLDKLDDAACENGNVGSPRAAR